MSAQAGGLLAPTGRPHLVYLVHGEDPALTTQALARLLHELAPAGDGLAPVEEYGEVGADEVLLGPVLDACRTPPFLSDQRIVVVRDSAKLDAAQVRELVAYLAEPLESTVLVLVHSARVPQALMKAVRALGMVVDAAPDSSSRARGEWLTEHLHRSGMRFEGRAATLLRNHLGEDLGRLEGILASLQAAYGPAATIGEEELEPYLGSAGGVAPWDLNDAIDAGETATALVALHRMLEAGERHPLQVLAGLHRHFSAMLALDGVVGLDEQGAARLTGLHAFPAGKALRQSRRLGYERLARAVTLIARADLDLRGESGLSGELVLEVLVARLAQLSRPAAARQAATRRRR